MKIVTGPYLLDFDLLRAYCEDRDLALTTREFLLLAHFVRNPFVTMSREDLLNAVWDRDERPSPQTVDVHLCRLRRKLGSEGRSALVTLGRKGYRWGLERVDPDEWMGSKDTCKGLGVLDLSPSHGLEGQERAAPAPPPPGLSSPPHALSPSLEWLEGHLRTHPVKARDLVVALRPLAEQAGRIADGAWFGMYEAWLAIDRDDYAHALRLLRPVLAVFRSLGNDVGLIRTLNAMGATLRSLGQFRRAISCYDRAFQHVLAKGCHRYGAAALSNLAESYHELGCNEAALQIALWRRDVFQVTDYNQPSFLHTLGVIHRDLGNIDKAEGYLREAIHLGKGQPHDALDSQRALAGLLLALGRIRESEALIEDGLADSEQLGERVFHARFQILKSRLMLLHREAKEVVPHLVASARTVQTLGARRAEVEALKTLSDSWRHLGDGQRAAEVHARYRALRSRLAATSLAPCHPPAWMEPGKGAPGLRWG